LPSEELKSKEISADKRIYEEKRNVKEKDAHQFS